MYKKNDNVGYWVGRNPFNRKQKAYNWWIYDFKYKQLPNCLSDNQ